MKATKTTRGVTLRLTMAEAVALKDAIGLAHDALFAATEPPYRYSSPQSRALWDAYAELLNPIYGLRCTPL